tara:strand:- start:1141 stop:1242 length:102 start_codon:yes stop_codon:yes gene_type:complete
MLEKWAHFGVQWILVKDAGQITFSLSMFSVSGV